MSAHLPSTPRDWHKPSDQAQSQDAAVSNGQVASHVVAPHDLSRPENRTEVTNSRRFVDRFGQSTRWVVELKSWAAWAGSDQGNDGRWRRDGDLVVQHMAKTLTDSLWEESEESRSPEVQKFCAQSSSARGIASIVNLAKCDPSISASFTDFDRHALLLNCPNGTLDLSTGVLRRHSRNDYLTKLCPTRYDPKAKCPLFRDFVRTIAGGQEEADYLQQALGMCVSGDVSEQALFIAYGDGSNGKSTLLETVRTVLGGDYAMKASRNVLMKSAKGQHPTVIADFYGMRLVSCIEQEQGEIDETLIKELTGGDSQRVRRMHQDTWQFDPTHKIFLAVNEKPVITGTDHGIWRRIHLIPFLHRFEGTGKDPKFREKLNAEREGILAYLVEGYQKWASMGRLVMPRSIAEAKEEYQKQMDPFGQFLEQCYTAGYGRVSATELSLEYRGWAEVNGAPPMSSTAIGLAMGKRGFGKVKSSVYYYEGLTARDGRQEWSPNPPKTVPQTLPRDLWSREQEPFAARC